MKTKKLCQQCTQEKAVVYAGGKGAGDWAGYYCLPCKQKLGFIVFDNHPNGVDEEVEILELLVNDPLNPLVGEAIDSGEIDVEALLKKMD